MSLNGKRGSLPAWTLLLWLMLWVAIIVWTVVLVGKASGSEPAGNGCDSYTFAVGAFQKLGPTCCHTWATFTHTDAAGKTERLVISWMPKRGGVHILHSAVPGMNWTEEETLAYAARHHARVSIWGPYTTTAEVWQRATVRKAELDSGQLWYIALDHKMRPDAVNCISAVLEITGRRVKTGIKYGRRASEVAVDELLRASR